MDTVFDLDRNLVERQATLDCHDEPVIGHCKRCDAPTDVKELRNNMGHCDDCWALLGTDEEE